MRIIEQTEVPAYPSFMHLAYAAAVNLSAPGGSAVGVIIIGLVVYYFIQRKRWVWKVLLGAAVAAASVAVFMAIAPSYTYPGEMTAGWAEEIDDAIVMLQDRHEQVPCDVEHLAQRPGVRLGHTRDTWGHLFRIKRYTDLSNTRYVVISAGPDGKFGTQDDIKSPQD